MSCIWQWTFSRFCGPHTSNWRPSSYSKAVQTARKGTRHHETSLPKAMQKMQNCRAARRSAAARPRGRARPPRAPASEAAEPVKLEKLRGGTMGGPSFCRLIGICHQVPDLGSGQPSKKRTGSGAKILCFVFGTLVPERRGHLDPLEGLGNRPEPAHLVQRDPFHADHRARLVASLVSSFRTPPGWCPR